MAGLPTFGPGDPATARSYSAACDLGASRNGLMTCRIATYNVVNFNLGGGCAPSTPGSIVATVDAHIRNLLYILNKLSDFHPTIATT